MGVARKDGELEVYASRQDGSIEKRVGISLAVDAAERYMGHLDVWGQEEGEECRPG